MKRLVVCAAIAAFAGSAPCQTSNSWGPLLSFYGTTAKWPAQLEAVHMCHMPPASGNQYGRILMWGHAVQDGEGDRSTQAYVWDTAPGHSVNFIDQPGQESVAPDTNMLLHNCDCFCGGHTGNAAGDVMIIGGELFGEDQGIRNVNYFKYSTLSWQPAAMMLRARWYPTLVPLSNGDMLAVEGQDENGDHMDIAEKFSSNAWTLVPADRFDEETQQLVLFDSDNYPLMFAIYDPTDNKVFWAGKRRRSDTTQEGLRSHFLNLSSGQPQYTPIGGHIPTEGSGAVPLDRWNQPRQEGQSDQGRRQRHKG
ncbi:MAG TPA: hypothetical protein VFG65_03615 [Fimbriimonadales bacterium]|nr:hypothetical protein [Fimbriimonadales bacterium]